MVYVMFVFIAFRGTHGFGVAAPYQYEFPTKAQCENAVATMKKRFIDSETNLGYMSEFKGYCQEVKKN